MSEFSFLLVKLDFSTDSKLWMKIMIQIFHLF